MKQSDLNHLRRLVAWIRGEIGQSPEEFLASYRQMAGMLGDAPITDEAKQRMVEAYDRARRAPKYVRAAVKALGKYVKDSSNGSTVEEEPAESIDLLHIEHRSKGRPPA
jgi:hypothetical protein